MNKLNEEVENDPGWNAVFAVVTQFLLFSVQFDKFERHPLVKIAERTCHNKQ